MTSVLKQAFIDSLAELGVNPEPLDLAPYQISTKDRRIVRADRSRASRKGKAEAFHQRYIRDPLILERRARLA